MTQNNDWRALAEKELRGRALDDLTWNTLEGIDVKPLYTEADTADLSHIGGIPGKGPFTRGVKATMYAGRPWTIRQYAGFLHGRGKPPMRFIAKPWLRGSRAFPWRLIWPRIVAMTAITRAL